MMRPVFIALMLILPSISLMLAVFGHVSLLRFAGRVKTLATQDDLEAFKRMAKTQMILALAVIPFIGIPAFLYGFGLFTGALSLSDLLFVLIPSGIVIVYSLVMKSTERKVKETPAADEDMLRERDRIVGVWMEKMLPDW
jgi:hypothetical protein